MEEKESKTGKELIQDGMKAEAAWTSENARPCRFYLLVKHFVSVKIFVQN